MGKKLNEPMDNEFAEKEIGEIIRYMEKEHKDYFGLVESGLTLQKDEFALSLDSNIYLKEIKDLEEFAKRLNCTLNELYTLNNELVFIFKKD